MKRKNIAAMATSIALVGVVAVGGTLALLTSGPKSVTNTFTVGKGYETADFTLDEAPIVRDTSDTNFGGYKETTGTRVTANTYANLVEGTTLAKDPQFHIAATCEVPYSWIVAKIDGFNTDPEASQLVFSDVDDTDLANDAVSGTWYKVTEKAGGGYNYTAVASVNDMGNGVYIYDTALTAGKSTKDLFQQLTVSDVKQGKNPSRITVSGYAVEAVMTDEDTVASFEASQDAVMNQVASKVF